VSCAKTAEPLEMPFGMWTVVGPSNHVLDGGSRLPHTKGQFLGERKYPVVLDDTAVSRAKMAEPIEMPFRLWTREGLRKHVLDGVHSGATWRIRLNRPCAAAMWSFLSNYFDHLLLWTGMSIVGRSVAVVSATKNG